MGVIINFLLAKELELCPKLIDKRLVNILSSRKVPYVTMSTQKKKNFMHVIHNIHYLTYQVAKIHEPLWFKDSIECDWTYSSNIVYV